MKKLINDPRHVVSDMLHGLIALYPGLSLLSEHGVLFRSDIEAVRNSQVAIISGGGSGHEPAHGGYIGSGMLSSAVAGEVFTSPTPDSILAAIQHVTGAPGVLLVVKNYTGDRLNFGLAAELARSQGFAVETVIVADDVALSGLESHAGARGLAGTVLIHKIAGAAAAAGQPVQAVAATARSAIAGLATIGLSLSAGTIPAVGKPSYLLSDDEVELGLGIHGEPGIRRMPLQRSDELASHIVQTITSAAQLGSGDRIAVVINNLGSLTAMELAIFGGRAIRSLQSLGMEIERVYSGAFVTSLDAVGVSLSILRVDDELLVLLDAPTSAPAWPNGARKPVGPIEERIIVSRPAAAGKVRQSNANPVLVRAIQAACRAVVSAEPRLTELDRASGDGDLGMNLARGATAVDTALSEDSFSDDAAVLELVASLFQSVVGGSSGPFYGVMLLRAAQGLREPPSGGTKSWARAALRACEAVAELGDAAPGDRTMLDALLPFAVEFNAAIDQGIPWPEALESAVRAAEAGAESTASMSPRRGRASYLGNRVIGHPDPGAIAVSIWLRALKTEISGHLAIS